MRNSSTGKDEARVQPVTKISSKFCILQPTEKQYLICDNHHKVVVFHLPNYISPLIPKPCGKIKQKLVLLFLYNMAVSCMTLTWHFCGE